MDNQNKIEEINQKWEETYKRGEVLLEKQKEIENYALNQINAECEGIIKRNEIEIDFEKFGGFNNIAISVNNKDGTFWSPTIAKMEYEIFGLHAFHKEREIFDKIDKLIDSGMGQEEIFKEIDPDSFDFVEDSIKINYGSGGYNNSKKVTVNGVEETHPVKYKMSYQQTEKRGR